MKTGIILTYTIQDIAHLVREDVKAKCHDCIREGALVIAPLSFRISDADRTEHEIGEAFSVTVQVNGPDSYIGNDVYIKIG